MNQPGNGVFVPNYLVWAVLTTLFCCMPLGIVSIVYATQVDGRRAAGDINGAMASSRSARNWAIAAVVAGPALLVIWFMFFGGLAFLGAMSNH